MQSKITNKALIFTEKSIKYEMPQIHVTVCFLG